MWTDASVVVDGLAGQLLSWNILPLTVTGDMNVFLFDTCNGLLKDTQVALSKAAPRIQKRSLAKRGGCMPSTVLISDLMFCFF